MSRRVWFFWTVALVALVPARVSDDSAAAFSSQTSEDHSAAAASIALESFGTGLPRRGQWRNAFAVADMNRDGNLDLVHGPTRKGRGWPVIFLGDGRGGFTRWAASFPRLPFDYGVIAVADFDGDGAACDFAIGSHLRGITVLVGNGKGEFQEWARGLGLRAPDERVEQPFTPGGLIATDWNKDGRVDLAGVSEGPARLALRAGESAPGGIRVFLNLREGWQTKILDPADGSLIGRSLAVGDVDADGRPDLLAGSATRGFNRILKWNDPTASDAAGRTALTIPGNAFVTAVALLDMDRNGRSDPVIAYSVAGASGWRNGIQVHLSHPGGFQVVDALQPALASPVRALAAGDLDADGQPDLAAVGDDGTLCVFRSEKNGRLTLALSEAAPQWRVGSAGYDVHLGDFDGDGRDEIVASFAGEPAGFDSRLTSNSGGGIQAWKCRTQSRHDSHD